MRDKVNKFPRMNKDAWSHGQVTSKLWLCEKLERIMSSIAVGNGGKPDRYKEYKIWIYGGWYGMTAFLLFSRGKMRIDSISSYDIEPQCEKIADIINNNWEIDEWRFKAFTQDVNDIVFSSPPDIIINTSCEHMIENKWFDQIPAGMIVALQSTDQKHDDEEHNLTYSLKEMIDKYPLSDMWFNGEKEFVYPDKKFKRYMIIGVK